VYVFEREQYIYDIGGVKVGGVPGENPTVLVGTIFYAGDKLVNDPKKGDFEKKPAVKQLSIQDELSDLTGNPCLVQIFAESSISMHNYIDFVSEHTDSPFLIDSTDPAVRVAGLQHAEEVGLIDKAIYNSINLSISQEEQDGLRELQHEAAIVLAFNPQDPSIAGRRAILEDGALNLEKGLIELSSELGVTKPLIDTATTAMGAGAGPAAAFTLVAKTLYGHPTGSGIHNAPSSWAWLRKYKKENKEAFRHCDISSNIMIQMLGADFILYGPIKNAELVFPVVAMGDVFSAETANIEFGMESVEGHPFRKLL
jgi:tetrahydromethanopterin S-methyltransferase subunit H